MSCISKILFSLFFFLSVSVYSEEVGIECPARAAELYEKALNSIQENNEISLESIDKAIELLDEAEKEGFKPFDALLYAKAYLYSQKEDYGNALQYYRKSAELGNLDAIIATATYCIEGKGADADGVEALKWYVKAAELEDVNAMFIAGILFSDGPQKDNVKSFQWFKKAAENGHVVSKKYLADCYAQGKGTAKNVKDAMIWYAAASDDGSKDAQSAMCQFLFQEKMPRELMYYAEMLAQNRDSNDADLMKADLFKAYASAQCKDYKKLFEIGKHYKFITIAAILAIALLIITPISIFIFIYLFIIWLANRNKAPALRPLVAVDAFAAFALFVTMAVAGGIFTIPLTLFFTDSIVFILGVSVLTGTLNVIFWMLVIKLRQNSILSGLSLHAPHIKLIKAFMYVVVTYALVVIFAELYEICMNYFNIKIDIQDVTRMICDTIKNSNSSLEIIFMILCVILLMPMIEEILFRGVIFNALSSALPAWGAGMLSSAMFAVVHFDILYFLPLFVMGVALCYLRYKTKSLYLPIILHSLNNLVSVVVCFYFPYPL